MFAHVKAKIYVAESEDTYTLCLKYYSVINEGTYIEISGLDDSDEGAHMFDMYSMCNFCYQKN